MELKEEEDDETDEILLQRNEFRWQTTLQINRKNIGIHVNETKRNCSGATNGERVSAR